MSIGNLSFIHFDYISKMRALLTLIILVVCVQSGISQDVNTFLLNLDAATRSGGYIVAFTNDELEIVGHPYAHNVWAKGSLTTSEGIRYENAELKYEAVSGVLAIRTRNDSLSVKPSVISEFEYSIGSEVYRFKNGFNLNDMRISSDQYLLVIHESKWSVYKQVRKSFKAADFDPVFNRGDRFHSFQDNSRIILKSPEGEWIHFTPNRRNINRVFGDNSRAVNNYVRQNNLDFGNDQHLARIFEFASGL